MGAVWSGAGRDAVGGGGGEEGEDHTPPPTGLPYKAVVFDIDGVITMTDAVHCAAWKAVFDEFLAARGAAEFTAEDFHRHVDGMERYAGVGNFLRHRGFDLPYGKPGDPPSLDSVCALGNKKSAQFSKVLAEQGVQSYPGTVDLMRALVAKGVPIAAASSSKNSANALKMAGLLELFDTPPVDGHVKEELKLADKWPILSLLCGDNRHVMVGQSRWQHAIVVEDAASGVKSGVKGGFKLVVGLAREGNRQQLRDAGAGVVLPDIGGTTPDQLAEWFRSPPREWFVTPAPLPRRVARVREGDPPSKRVRKS